MSDQEVIAFLPWVVLKERVDIGPVSFVPSNIIEDCAECRREVEGVLESYRDIEGNSVNNWTMVYLDGRDPPWKLAVGDEGVILDACRVLAVASISGNEYFQKHSSYANASVFAPIFQRCSGSGRLTLLLQRRDYPIKGGGYTHEFAYFTKPLETMVVDCQKVDQSFAQAIWKAKNSGVGSRIMTALSFFCQASTDSELISPDAEVILMASAFDQVFEIERDNAYQLAQKIGDLFKDYDSIPVERAKTRKINVKPDKGKDDGHNQKGWKVLQKWMEEFYHLRNEKVHGNKKRKDDEWAWSREEHLIMSSFVFPLAVKCLLGEESRYSLKDKDKQLCDSVDFLLATKPGRWSYKKVDTNGLTIWPKLCRRCGKRSRQESIDRVNKMLGKTNVS